MPTDPAADPGRSPEERMGRSEANICSDCAEPADRKPDERYDLGQTEMIRALSAGTQRPDVRAHRQQLALK